jgi:hypothetical protein
VLNLLETSPLIEQPTMTVQIPFVARTAGGVHLAIKGALRRPAPTVLQVGQMELFHLGPASFQWTSYLRGITHMAQKFYITAWMLPLALVGGLMLKARHGRWLTLLLVIPLYYLTAQPFLHTEYRYVMAMQPVLFVLVAFAVYCIGIAIGLILKRTRVKLS